VVTIPAIVWRGGFVRRALTIGGVVGLCVGVLAWLDSGFLLAGVIVLVVVGSFYGIWMSRRMVRYWPGSGGLAGDERVTVARAARRGERIADERLAQPVIDYTRALHLAAESTRMLRWVLALALVVAIATAVWDAAFGSWGNVVASAVYLVALVVEVFWWPRRQARLLANADRAADIAERALERDSAE
jgi:hypothetical protein